MTFKKSFDTSLLDDIIASTVKRGIDMGVFDPNNLCSESTAFIPLRTSSKKPLVGDCGKPLSLHSHYRETKRNILRNKYVCDNPSNCPLNKYNCYAYRNFSKDV
ncbi:hypothetical protein [Petrotoga mobilis]|uniref:hypothetical protein n=1 Tax=Petrotoga mobilis TaxID=69499 RepID=UPI0005A0B454|nr:hypothetical protein [Petrotoga mobilis]